MIRSSALYISLIISILILLVCGSLLMIGYTYKMQEQKQMRGFKLHENLESGMQVLLTSALPADSLMRLRLFGEEGMDRQDSVQLEKRQWGIYELGTVSSWIGQDTLEKAFLIGTNLSDTLKVLYLADEDRPMSISGKSLIRGTAYLPKSGIKAAYVESSGYDDKILVHGLSKYSSRQLPQPGAEMLKSLSALLEPSEEEEDVLPDSAVASFYNPSRRIHLGKEEVRLSAFTGKGNVMIFSDSVIIVEASSLLDKIILVAPCVKIEAGFRGNVQVIASDSIVVGDRVRLDYPSALLVLKNDTAKFQASIKVGKDAQIAGQLFAYEKEHSVLMPMISIGTGTMIKGEIWSQGYVGLSKTASVYGSVSAIRLMARLSGSIYENYLIDVKLDKTLLSRYYLSSKLLNTPSKYGGLLCTVK
ncbi:MAG: hypothetical protein V4594_17825 [Bacteroidota bacterium]